MRTQTRQLDHRAGESTGSYQGAASEMALPYQEMPDALIPRVDGAESECIRVFGRMDRTIDRAKTKFIPNPRGVDDAFPGIIRHELPGFFCHR